MTTTICFGDAADGYLENFSTTYTTARDGGGTYSIVDTAGDSVRWGEKFATPTYFCTEAFLSWAYTVPATETVTAAYIRLRAVSAANTAVTRALEVREYDWGASMATADWRTAAQFSALTQMAAIDSAQNAGTSYILAGSDSLVTRLSSASPLRVVCTSDRQRSSTVPSVDEEAYFSSADAGGTGDDPALIFTSVPQSQLYGVLGAQVQLSDGTHVFIESSTVDISAAPVLKHHNGVSASTIATLSGLPACVDLDTEIFTDTGWKRYDQVVVGDLAQALDPDSGEQVSSEVLAVRQYAGQHFAYRMGGDLGGLVATQGHRWLVHRDGRLQWVLTAELAPTDAIPTPGESIPVAGLDLVTARISDTVWCPTTQHGTWLARRAGVIFYTGNKP